MATAPVEKKVKAASVAAYLGSTGLLAILAVVQGDSRMVEWMPDWLSPFALGLVPAAITAVSGWAAKHTPRTRSVRSGGDPAGY